MRRRGTGVVAGAAMLTAIHHVQLAMPEGREQAALDFYVGVLGLTQVPKPARLAARGGCWFECGSVNVHLGVMKDFTPATKAHPAFLVRDLAAMRARCADAGVLCAEAEPLEGFARFYVFDPFGNRIELMETV
ncbi:MAG: VOC family protein [Pseudomonadota bacterium]